MKEFSSSLWYVLANEHKLQCYPDDKEDIKFMIEDMLNCLNETAQNYIEYCIECELFNELMTMWHYWKEFGLTEDEQNDLEQQIIMLKLIS